MFSPRQSVGYATFPGKMSAPHPGKLDGRFPPVKLDGPPYHGKRDGQFYDTDMPYPGRGRRDYMPSDLSGRPYPGVGGNRGDYDSDIPDYYHHQSRDLPRDIKQGSRDLPPDNLPSHPRYMPHTDTRSHAPYPPRRGEEDEVNRLGSEPDYRRQTTDASHIPPSHRKYDRPDDYHDNPRLSTESSRYAGGHLGFQTLRDEKETEEGGGTSTSAKDDDHRDPSRDVSTSYLQRTTNSTDTTPSSRPDTEKDDHLAAFRDKPSFNYGDYGPTVQNRSPDIGRRQSAPYSQPSRDSRPPYDFEGGNYATYNKNTPPAEPPTLEPGDYVSMAGGGGPTNGGDNEGGGGGGNAGGMGGGDIKESESPCEDVKPKGGNEEFAKNNESPNNVYMGEEEIPIVTRSDELEET